MSQDRGDVVELSQEQTARCGAIELESEPLPAAKDWTELRYGWNVPACVGVDLASGKDETVYVLYDPATRQVISG